MRTRSRKKTVLVASLCAMGLFVGGIGGANAATSTARPVARTTAQTQAAVVQTPSDNDTAKANDRWKIFITMDDRKADMGLGYEWARIRYKEGPVELPWITGDVMLTPDRFGFGASVSLNDYLNLMVGVCHRFDTDVREGYAGLGVRFKL